MATTTEFTVEVAESTSTFGVDYRGTAGEGVIVRTLDVDGALTVQAAEVTIGFRNYAEAIDRVIELRTQARADGSGEWWLAFEASGAVGHFTHYGHPVPAELAALVAQEA